jgi:tol-pal system protein YbgF
MKRVLLYSLMLLGFSTLLIQCVATQSDVEYTNVQVRKVDSKVDDIDKEVSELKKQTVRQVRERQAETGDRLDNQQSEMLKLQGQIEENNFFIRQVQEENRELKKLLLSRLDTSNQVNSEEINHLKDRLTLTEEQLLKAYDRLAYAEKEIKAIKNARSAEASKRAMEAAQKASEAEKKARLAAKSEPVEKKSTKAPREILPEPYKIDVSDQNITGTEEEKEVKKTVSKPVKKTVSSPPPAPPKTPVPPATATSYDQGMKLFKQEKYREAYNSFAEYLDKNRTGSQAINARYYAAQSLYEDKDYELAILEFQKVIVEHPKDSLAPKALYKQGLSFEKIGDPETARIVYNKLVDSYPKSAETDSAKTRLNALKK